MLAQFGNPTRCPAKHKQYEVSHFGETFIIVGMILDYRYEYMVKIPENSTSDSILCSSVCGGKH
jgi:hypothetical protein